MYGLSLSVVRPTTLGDVKQCVAPLFTIYQFCKVEINLCLIWSSQVNRSFPTQALSFFIGFHLFPSPALHIAGWVFLDYHESCGQFRSLLDEGSQIILYQMIYSQLTLISVKGNPSGEKSSFGFSFAGFRTLKVNFCKELQMLSVSLTMVK